VSVNIASISAFTAALADARSIDLCAYTLPAGPVREALAGAAERGALVRVRLERDPLDDAASTLHRANADAVTRLTAAGADAALTAIGSPVLHMKAAVVDGVAWLDDRNWPAEGAGTLVRDTDPDDVAAVVATLAGGDRRDGHLRTTKAGAQALERDVVRGAAAAPLAIESESFGSGAIYDALLSRALAGHPTRLLVAGRELAEGGTAAATEHRRLARLAALGVEIRTGVAGGVDFDEKLAVAPDAAWIGSANATYARGAAGEQRDWGLLTRAGALIGDLRAAFDRNWDMAQPLVPGTPRASVSTADPGPKGWSP